MTSASSNPETGGAAVRVDRWLWAARMFKTRSQAGKACDAGQVKVNGVQVKAAKLVRAGDELDVETHGGRRLLEVVSLSTQRGSAPVARTLYVDHSPALPAPEKRDVAVRSRGSGRPVKRERRLLIRLRGR